MGYTGGKWQVAGRNADGYAIKQVGSSCKIAQVIKDGLYVNQETALANAHLIAQAPLMAEWIAKIAKQDFVIFWEDRGVPEEIIQTLGTLAKAKGA